MRYKEKVLCAILLACSLASSAIAQDNLTGMWAKCSLPCLDDNLSCWTNDRLELEWYTPSGKSIYISGFELRDEPLQSLALDFPDSLSDLETSLSKISRFEIFASIGEYSIDGSRLVFETPGDGDPFSALFSGVSDDRYSYSFTESDGEVTTIEMCRTDSFSPLFFGLARYLNSRNALDPSFESIKLTFSDFMGIGPSTTAGDQVPFFPIPLVSDDGAFAVLLDPVASGSSEGTGLTGNIHTVSPEVTLVFNVLNDVLISDALRSAF